MSKQRPATETMTASEARQHFASTINKVARDEARVIVEKNGVPVAAIVPIEDVRSLERQEIESTPLYKAVQAMREAFQGVPQEEIEREADKAIKEVRAEMRAEWERLAARSDQ